MKPKLTHAMLVGLVPAILEGLLIYGVEPTASPWILAQAMLFWFTCGCTVHLLESSMPRLLFAVVFTVFLNLPWYIAESVGKNKPEHALPLLIASIVMGLVIGVVSGRLRKRSS